MQTTTAKNVDEYILSFPESIQEILHEVRKTIRAAAPEAEELISYHMPAYRLNGILVYYAAFKNHIGFYATPTGHDAFRKELFGYKTGKGSVQFPLDQPMPLDLITEMVKFRVAENLDKLERKSASK